jgi:hypothetical protein
LVVPTKESLRKSTAVLNAPEAVRELRTIFHGAELTLRIWAPRALSLARSIGRLLHRGAERKQASDCSPVWFRWQR